MLDRRPVLFTKANCPNCAIIKEAFDLEALCVRVGELPDKDGSEEAISEDGAEALALLAWYELIEHAEEALPILMLDHATACLSMDKIVYSLALRGAACL